MSCPTEETVPCRSWLATLTLSKRWEEYCITLPNKEAELPGVRSDDDETEFARPAPSAAMVSCWVPLLSCGEEETHMEMCRFEFKNKAMQVNI